MSKLRYNMIIHLCPIANIMEDINRSSQEIKSDLT